MTIPFATRASITGVAFVASTACAVQPNCSVVFVVRAPVELTVVHCTLYSVTAYDTTRAVSRRLSRSGGARAGDGIRSDTATHSELFRAVYQRWSLREGPREGEQTTSVSRALRPQTLTHPAVVTGSRAHDGQCSAPARALPLGRFLP
jgi:hypothetical protein